ncbi:hypothetical protein DPEC_G00318350 [Dallia pectoralis]|uniref:Uncharacterized protein n=1 Tax=Dallia pectoralis TaxID=75939 RepID=A0ACC2F9K5_DALPE|nr:hypothetical protein DPEC_G00318350 [Dallia pectoralis]
MGKGPGGKINRPKTDLGKKLFKRRRVMSRDKRKNHMKVGAVVDAGLTTIHHLKKRITSPRANITLSGKKKRKLLKQLQHMEAEKAAIEAEMPPKKTNPSAAQKTPAGAVPISTRRKKGNASQQDVEMADTE